MAKVVFVKPRPSALHTVFWDPNAHFFDQPPENSTVDHTDPFSISLIHRKLKEDVEIFFHRGRPGRAGPGAKVTEVSRAGGPWVANGDRPVVPGFYSVRHQRGGETLTIGECDSLKLQTEGGKLHVYLPPYA